MPFRRCAGSVATLLILALPLFAGALSPVAAQTYQDVQSGRLPSLPHEMTPEEAQIRHEIGRAHRTTPPPEAQPVRNVAEFERMSGVLIRYPLGISTAIVAEMSEEVLIYCVVTSSQQSSAYNAFVSGGVNMSNVIWLNAASDSYWTRDYGPWFIFDDDGDLAIIDTIYNRPRPNDDVIPQVLADRMGIPCYGPDLEHTGGNWMTDGDGIAVSTDLVWDENADKTPAEINEIVDEYLGIATYHVVPDVNGEYIRHIDCWAKYLAVDKILIREVPPSHSQYDEIEAAVDYFEGRNCAYGWPYEVVRVYTPNDEPYTNSLILNDKVLVPITGSQWDDDALAAYETALPGYEVLGFTGSWASTDALHCRTHGVADPGYLYVYSTPLRDTGNDQDPYQVAAKIYDHSEAGLIANELRVYWRAGTAGPFSHEVMTAIAGTDSFYAEIPAQPFGTTVEYYVHAADNSGREEDYPLVGPDGPFRFAITAPIAIATDEYPNTEDTTGPYTITTTATDESRTITDVELLYRVNGGAFQGPITMTPQGSDLYAGDIPGQGYTSIVEYYVRAADDAEHEVFDPPTAPTDCFEFLVAPRVNLLTADMESGSDWTHAPISGGFGDQWHLSTQRNHTPGGDWSWKCGDTGGGDYDSYLDAGLTTHSFALGAESHLTFWHHVAAETSGAYPGRAYDGGLVEINTGSGWVQIEPLGGYPFTSRGTSGPFPEGTGIFSGHYDWALVDFDLSAFEGDAQLRFRFGSDAGAQDEGWYIDDVAVDGFQLDPQDIADVAPTSLLQTAHWPNPVRGGARIELSLPQPATAQLAIYDPTGRLVRVLTEAGLEAGTHRFTWDRTDRSGRRVAPGVYYYRLEALGRSVARPMVVLP